MAEILQGGPVAAALAEQAGNQIKALRQQGIIPTLAIVRIGDNPDDIAYEKSATKRCEANDAMVKHLVFAADIDEDVLIANIKEINRDDEIDGCLLLKPLPQSLNEYRLCTALDPAKDIDGITPGSLAAVFGAGGSGFPPCTAQACIEILQYYGVALSGSRVVVVGRSLVVGKPVAMLLLAQNATVTVCHSKSRDLPTVVRQADIVIAALGREKFLGPVYFRPGQIVIDVGINFDQNGKMCGDVDFMATEPMVRAITPVPGGVGAVTNAVL
ncbi:MAG: tetrahydrofolate dehydrogenase/cyclohydrolase catalytic domain-containing protein, partial [Clostridiales bacterium]